MENYFTHQEIALSYQKLLSFKGGGINLAGCGVDYLGLSNWALNEYADSLLHILPQSLTLF